MAQQQLPDQTESPMRVTLADGKEYMLSPLTFGDLAAIERDFQADALAAFARAFDKPMPDATRAAIVAAITMKTPEQSAWWSTAAGRLGMLFYSLQHAHKNVTREQVSNLAGSIPRARELADLVDRLTFPQAEADAASPFAPSIPAGTGLTPTCGDGSGSTLPT